MDLSFLTNVLGGKGSSPIAALLPLLLGGKTPDLSSLLGLFSKKEGAAQGETGERSDDFPPLFGDIPASSNSDKGDLVRLLGNMIPQNAVKDGEPKPAEKYPYELQYNRPYKP